MKPSLRHLVDGLLQQNPELAKNPTYLLLETWNRQGLRLYPNQRDLILGDKLSKPDAILRAGRKMRADRRKAKKQATIPIPIKVR